MCADKTRAREETELVFALSWAKHTEMTLDFPVSAVWPMFKDMRRWYTEYDFDNVSGPPYEAGTGYVEGQVVKVKSAVGMPRSPNDGEPPAGPQHFIVETVKVAPEQQIVVLLSGSAYDWKQFVQFYVWTMQERGGQTTVFVDAYGNAVPFTPLSNAESIEYKERLLNNWHRSWSEALLSLKKALEEQRNRELA